mmetsp:Transcript_25087/g.39382  ORF Transcript_25087/g.39382 Transcript_25087/m.39382 type:complete len:139 (-) Transcript_25087:1207-1623(-)
MPVWILLKGRSRTPASQAQWTTLWEASTRPFLPRYGWLQAQLKEQLQNLVKKCSACGRPCGFSLTVCNACGANLPNDLVYTHNVFTGFIFGVAKGPFPFTISMRVQTQDFLVIDDLLALTHTSTSFPPLTTSVTGEHC